MQTLKIKYQTSEENLKIISSYRKEFSYVLRYAYNRRMDGLSEKETEHLSSSLNNVFLIKSFLTRCAVKNATQLTIEKEDKKRIIFGGKKNFINRCQNKIDKETFLSNRLSKLYIIGEANKHSNRMVKINEDCNSFIFKPTFGIKMELTICGGYRRYKRFLKKLYQIQQLQAAPITYQLDNEYIYVIFDEKVINQKFVRKDKPIKNRIFGIDLNPNYVGWSVVDWKSSSEYNIIQTGVISIKDINDYYNSIKGADSSDKRKIYINNKRTHEIYEISKLLVNTALHYKCEAFSFEELNIESSDKGKGAKYNKLVNNQWDRDKLVNNIQKRCNINDLVYLEVKPNYSSFIGNFLFRDGVNPDMVLSSIEIGRRGYEFYNQYIIKKKEQKKNIVQPIVDDFKDNYVKSLEEFNIEGEFKDLVELYKFLKNSKCRYRVSFKEVKLGKSFSRCFSKNSKVMKFLINNYKIA